MNFRFQSPAVLVALVFERIMAYKDIFELSCICQLLLR